MRKFLGFTGMFALGGLGYGLIEILWRGRTHWSMITAGGLCFILLGKVSNILSHSRRLIKCIAGSAVITSIEFVFGIVFNKLMNLAVWDYSKRPFNILGQVCLLYSVLWGFLCVPFMPLAEKAYNKVNTCKKNNSVIKY